MNSIIPCSIPLPIRDLIPGTGIVAYNSRLHGRLHIARVMVHALILADKTNRQSLKTALWAAVFLHDIARQHDGNCRMHGEWAIQKWLVSKEIQAILHHGGVAEQDYLMITTAVVNHCLPEIPSNHTHYELTAFLKDADGLDRVRLFDLNPRFLRFPESKGMIGFAEELYYLTEDYDHQSPELMEWVWTAAESIL